MGVDLDDIKPSSRTLTGFNGSSETILGTIRLPEDNPRGNGEGDSLADEEQPANRRRIEVIPSQQTLSSDDKNDDTPVLEDLRDVLKQKFESEDSKSSKHNDLRTILDARKSRRISTGDPDPKERPNDVWRKLRRQATTLRR
ncbi:hypothetical protein F2Q70_00004420 [Brassica cretica]|uniref:Uncharacterized protein n=1 Tax=Brassica cretica TaxID=69181 RepID=A0A8S9IJL9_BRACR|nr:hypothetical protein F2Q70_00004420 [Brassica cretica]